METSQEPGIALEQALGYDAPGIPVFLKRRCLSIKALGVLPLDFSTHESILLSAFDTGFLCYYVCIIHFFPLPWLEWQAFLSLLFPPSLRYF